MKKCFKFALIIGLLLCFAGCLTGCGGAEYDQNDIAAINQLIDEHGWDVPKDDVKAWDFVTAWSKDNPRRVESMALSYKDEPVVGTLDLSAFTELTFLNISGNYVENLILPESIVDLTCPYNRLRVLDLSNAKNLESLYCGDNEQLRNIYYDSLPALKYMSCSDNQLTELNIEGLPNVQSIDVSSNQLTKLDISSLSTLRSLDCSDNPISDLKIEGMPQFNTLSCNGELLRNLSLKDLTGLESIHCHAAQLESVQIENTPNLRSLYFYEDAGLNIYTEAFQFHKLDYFNRQLTLIQPNAETVNLDEWEGFPDDAVINGNTVTFTITPPEGGNSSRVIDEI